EWHQDAALRTLIGRQSGAFLKSSQRSAQPELTLGFWTFLLQDNKEKTLWVPLLHRAFIPRAARRQIHSDAREIRLLRNKFAHHQLLSEKQIETLQSHVASLSEQIAVGFSDYIFGEDSAKPVA
ncbi:MAG: hypothetical protein RL670_783, partial [Actinomycetota bacterium]